MMPSSLPQGDVIFWDCTPSYVTTTLREPQHYLDNTTKILY
jgi:hypothetical protein